MRSLIIVLVVLGTLGTIGWLAWERFGPDLAPAGRGEVLANAEEMALMLGDLDERGFVKTYGEELDGVRLARASGGGAVFQMPRGAEIRVTAPARYELEDRFVVLGRHGGGFVLRNADSERFYFTFIDTGRPREPATEAAAEALYANAAERLESAGEIPLFEETASIVAVSPTKEAVYYCLKSKDGTYFHAATTFIASLTVTAMNAGICRDDTAVLERRLALAETALAVNR